MLSSRASGSIITKTMVLVVAVVAAFSTANAADKTYVGFTTFLREGPGIRYRPIDEALGGAEVDVIGCGNAWCEIWYGGATGYVAQNALTTADPDVVAIENPVCFDNLQSSYHGARDYRFCYSGAAKTTR